MFHKLNCANKISLSVEQETKIRLHLGVLWGGYFRQVYPKNANRFFGYQPKCLNPGCWLSLAITSLVVSTQSWVSRPTVMGDYSQVICLM